MWALIPNVMGLYLEVETLGLLGHESGTLMNEISALIRETPQGSFTLLTM